MRGFGSASWEMGPGGGGCAGGGGWGEVRAEVEEGRDGGRGERVSCAGGSGGCGEEDGGG